MGGPPAADLKYGIIAIPIGEEGVLFGLRPDHVVNQAFLDAVTDANREYFNEEMPLHNPEGDSDEFVRGRFDDGNRSEPGSVSGFRRVELTPPRIVDGDEEKGKQQEEEGDLVMGEAEEGDEKKTVGRTTTRAVRGGGCGIQPAACDQAADKCTETGDGEANKGFEALSSRFMVRIC